MNGIEKLYAYQNACKTIIAVEDDLCQMVDAFFKDCTGSWFFHSIDYGNEFCTTLSVPNVANLCVDEVITGEGKYYTLPVPTLIILKYLDGNQEEAAKEFIKWRNEYWEQKKREQEEVERREKEALTKKKEEDEYQLYLKLKEKFEK